MRRSLLSYFGHLVSASLAACIADLTSRTFPTSPGLAYGLPTPDSGAAPTVKPHRRYERRQDPPSASLSFGLIRQRATTLFARYFDTQQKHRASGWMATT